MVKQGTIKVEHRNEEERKLGYIKDPYAQAKTIDLDLTQDRTCPLTNIDKDMVSPLQHDVDMDEIPFYLRESVQRIIDKRVQIRIDEEMAKLKEEIKTKLKSEKESNQEQITTALNEITGRPNTVQIANPKLEGTDLEWANHFEKGDPRVTDFAGAGVNPYYHHPAYYGRYPGYRRPYGQYGYGAYGYPPVHPAALPAGTLHDAYTRGYHYNVSPIRAITKKVEL